MGFYDLSKLQRAELSRKIHSDILNDLKTGSDHHIIMYFGDADTYIRKAAYLATGRIYAAEETLRQAVLAVLEQLLQHTSFHIRQTVINAAGEIGMTDFTPACSFMDRGLTDPHHTVRNAVIGSVKKMGQKNPEPVLSWCKPYLQHPDKEIRREICHGIELRGRTHPQDILPMLRELQFDKTARVANTLVHVLGQIAYKKGCLQTVVRHLKTWENQALIAKAMEEIIDVHDRYRSFAVLTQEEARRCIESEYSLSDKHWIKK